MRINIHPIIGCDLDGTLLSTYEYVAFLWKLKTGKSFNLSAMKDFAFLSSAEEGWMRACLDKVETYLYTQPYVFSVDIIKQLWENNGFYFITARDKKYRVVTEEQLYRFGLGHRDLTFSNLIFTTRDKKPDICHEYGINIMIEDEVCYVGKLQSHGIKVILLNRPWNSDENKCCDASIRVQDWLEVEKKIGGDMK
jgi:uncharacterized HAD superfamily protein